MLKRNLACALIILLNVSYAGVPTETMAKQAYESAKNLLFDPDTDEAKNTIRSIDNMVKRDSFDLRSVGEMMLSDNLKDKVPNLLGAETFPKDVSDFIENMSPTDINALYDQLKSVPEGEMSSEVQALLKDPKLQDPKKLAEALKTMKVGPLTSLVHSIDSAKVKRLAEQTYDLKHSTKEPLNIMTLVANGAMSQAAVERTTQSDMTRKLLSSKGLANVFGGALTNRIVKKKTSEDNYITAVSYEMTEQGYSVQDTNKIFDKLDEKMDAAISNAAQGRFDVAADLIIDYENTVKQFQVNEIYNISELDPNKVTDLAERLGKASEHPTHKRVVAMEEESANHKLKEGVFSGNPTQATTAAAATTSSVTNKIRETLLAQLAAKLHITDPKQKAALAKRLDANPDFNLLIQASSKAFMENIMNATKAARMGDSAKSAEYLTSALANLAFMQHPEELARVSESVIADIISGKIYNEKEGTGKEENKKSKSNVISLEMVEYKPPEDKPIIVREVSSDVIREREIAAGTHPEAYSMHETVATPHTNAAKHNFKSASKSKESAQE